MLIPSRLKHSLLLSLMLPLASIPTSQANEPVTEESPFTSHGVMAAVSERRGFMAVEDDASKKWIIGFARDVLSDLKARTSLLLIDPATGESKQFFYPDATTANGDVFALFFSSKGKLYTTIGATFLEFDLKEQKFTFAHTKPVSATDRLCFSLCEAPDGKIYFASYPTAMLEVYDPEKGTVTDVIQLDDEQKYPTTMVHGKDGWIYTGLGSSRRAVVAYHPQSGEKRQIIPDDEREIGPGVVLKDRDGEVYASFGPEAPYRRPYRRLEGGAITDQVNASISKPSAPYPENSLYAFNNALKYRDGASIEDFDLTRRAFTYRKADDSRSAQRFDYQSEGASIASLITASDGTIYGCTDHPMQFWEYAPTTGKAINHGGMKRIGGGNFTHFVSLQGQLVSNTYSGGLLYSFDPKLPFQPEDENAPNPRLLAETSPQIARPRAMIAHPDGQHVVSAGWPGYGHVGGGMLIYHLEKGASEMIASELLSPGQSISALTALENGDLLYGTSIATPGGANPVTTTGKLGLFDWKERKTTWLEEPVPGQEQIWGLAARGPLAYGVTYDPGIFFVYDLKERKVIRTRSLAKHGSPAGRRGDTCFVSLPDGRLLLVMQKAIFEVRGNDLELLDQAPEMIIEVGDVREGKLYFSCSSRLWSYKLPESDR